MPVANDSEAPEETKRLVHDSTLTAFAQLGAFRLDCQRSFISLMDHDNQYILAEATRSVSLHKLDECAPGDEVYLGPRILDLILNIDTSQIKASPASYVMNDLSQIDSFKDRPYVSGWPFMKFYAEVPITSPTGHVIGAFCVVDNKPRDGLGYRGLESLTEISSAIIKHLELVQMQNHFHRADKMLHGLGMFVEKKGLTMRREGAFLEPLASEEMQRLFSRACYRIREGLELDGVMLIDACFQDIDLESGASTNRTNTLSTPRTTGYEDNEWAAIQDSSQASRNAGKGTSTRTLGSDRALTTEIPLRRPTLRSLLQTFREGTVFAFEKDGEFLDNSDGNGNDLSVAVNPGRLKKWATELSNACPGARSIMFFPLWDNHFDQWFACVLAWTTDYARIIHPSDINYLAAFTSCIMSEKSRLDVTAAAREKMDFISSVSHELRSPLHGVLASSEALQETSTGLLQDDMIRTITICGEVLLDTMDQILDYAKTSKALLPRKSPLNSNTDTPTDAGAARKAKPLDPSDIIEFTMESVYYGHDFHKSTFATSEDLKQSLSSPIDPSSTDSKVMLILNIAKENSWIKSHVSAWTRILMNLFGNALKYTKSGFVNVTLKSEPSPSSKFSTSNIVTLQVEDSGKGMSEHYLKYNVFTPFVQEDQMAVGTGLGLSIVRHLVRELGGQIDIQSEVRQGTKVTVSVLLHQPSAPPIARSIDSEYLLLDVKLRTKGLRLCLVDFDYYPDVKEEPTGILSTHAKSMIAVKQSLTSMAIDWFAMEVITSPNLASATGDVLLGLRSKLNLLEEHSSSVPLIVFEDTTESRLLSTKGVQYLSMPAGPHMFARVLKVCLDTKHSPVASTAASAKVQSASISSDQSPCSAISSSPVAISISPFPSPVRNKVLLVEDNAVNMKILMHCMRSAKQEYVAAMNGLEALEQYQVTPDVFKVIFMDLSMPIMDGLTSTRHIRAYEEEQCLPRTRIVALTCFSSEKYQREASDSGVDLYIVKPVPMKALKPILALDPEDFDHRDEGLRTPNSIEFGSPL
ncbi:hypothetical protein DL98DRAFT_468841 [Cadophora sp. DSE1049]|nr:hypothetical protein DL98DRAFT_468841 [Cadophora sp. DSE1049]